MPDFFSVQLSLSTQVALRTTYGVLLLGTLIIAWLLHGRFFLSERWKGYSQSSFFTDAIQNPLTSKVVMVLWFACAVGLTIGWHTVACALINLIFSYYFFIAQRWKGIARGMGAPGFVTYWLGMAVFLTEYTLHFAPQLRGLALLVLQVDFALIMFSAGIYKMTAGYAHNHGMEFGMANPQWGYWSNFCAKIPPEHWVLKTLNHLAWSTEIVAAILMVIPQTRFWGGLLIFLSFMFIITQIRLVFLGEMVMACCLIFFQPGSPGDQIIASFIPMQNYVHSTFTSTYLTPINTVLAVALCLYLCLTPLAHAGLYYNLYARRRLPAFLQSALEAYTNFFGIIVWRVFSADLTNFFVQVFQYPAAEPQNRTLLSRYGWGGALRFNYVCESITLTSLFTTRKYHPSNLKLFHERLLRYARTLGCPKDSLLDFEYVSVCKRDKTFEYVPVIRYTVDLINESIQETILDPSISVSAPHAHSPIMEGTRPGSYAPLVR